VVGLKPSYGLVSTQGIIPLSVSLDHAGPITRSTEDAAILLDALAGSKYRENLGTQIGSFALGIPKKFFFEDLDSEVALAVEHAIDQLTPHASSVREIDLPVSVDRTLQAAESYTYHREMIASSRELYDPETLRRILSGEGITSQEYENALRDLKKQRREIAQTFREIAVFVTPTTPIPAPPISALLKDRALLRPAELILLRNTRPVNVWGLPAISVPCGFPSQGLPIGLQIVGPPSGERKVLQVAHAYEKIREANSRE
jgi:Asp-tRNA(Asn)/Glu-tRNA(Gln) amidotransferase A subunit family amidase